MCQASFTGLKYGLTGVKSNQLQFEDPNQLAVAPLCAWAMFTTFQSSAGFTGHVWSQLSGGTVRTSARRQLAPLALAAETLQLKIGSSLGIYMWHIMLLHGIIIVTRVATESMKGTGTTPHHIYFSHLPFPELRTSTMSLSASWKTCESDIARFGGCNWSVGFQQRHNESSDVDSKVVSSITKV